MLWDNHMHTNFSGDSEANPLEMIEAAKNKNLRGITFTDHLDIDYADEPGLFDLDVENYFHTYSKLAAENTTKDFSLLVGIELGLQPHVAKENKAVIDKYDFDVVIGSTHVIDKKDPYYPSFWEGATEHELFLRYYEQILENILACPHFDTLGHLDYVFRYHSPKDCTDSYTPYAEVVDAILQEIIKRDIALEINTGICKLGIKTTNPAANIICRYKELGGRLLTIGADAHKPEHVAIGYDFLPKLIKDCGFNEYAVYKKRVPTLVALP